MGRSVQIQPHNENSEAFANIEEDWNFNSLTNPNQLEEQTLNGPDENETKFQEKQEQKGALRSNAVLNKDKSQSIINGDESISYTVSDILNRNNNINQDAYKP